MSRLTLDPKWWRQEMSATVDLDAGLLSGRRCDECGQRRGTRCVLVDEGTGPPPSPDPLDHRFRWWCARCICADMLPLATV